MSRKYEYATLMCSLPACHRLFAATHTPISRIQLEKRLSLLSDIDAKDISILAQLLDWFRHPLNRGDDVLLDLVDDLLPQIHHQSIVHYIEWRLEFRSLVAALRNKNLNQSSEFLGYGRWVSTIKKNWHEPYFSLEKIFPWMVNVAHLLKEQKAKELEKYILNLVWQWLEAESFSHEFDLEAVAIYRMRWDLVARWTCYAKEPAEERFKNLLDAAFNTQTTLIGSSQQVREINYV